MKKIKLTKVDRDQLNEEIISRYRKGDNRFDIEKYLTSIGREEKSIRVDIFLANQEINERARLEREALINTHVKRYEEIYTNNIELTLTSSKIMNYPSYLQKQMLIDKYNIALEALIAKERVLGLHTRNFRVQLNNFFKKKIVQKYHFGKQSFEELVLLKGFLEMIKSNEIIEENEIIQDNNKESNTIDADYVIINDEASSKMKEKKIKDVDDQIDIIDSLEKVKTKIIKKDIQKNDHKRTSLIDKLKKL